MRKDYVNGESFVAHQFVDHIETIDRLCNIVYGWCAVCCACGCIFIVLSLYCICFSKVFFFLDFEAADAATDYARMKRWKENSSKCLIIYRFTQHLLHKNSEQHSRLQLKWYLDKRRIHVSQEENSENKTKIQRAKKKIHFAENQYGSCGWLSFQSVLDVYRWCGIQCMPYHLILLFGIWST